MNSDFERTKEESQVVDKVKTVEVYYGIVSKIWSKEVIDNVGINTDYTIEGNSLFI